MLSDGGKGSARRKEDSQAVRDGWDRIFGAKKDTPMNDYDDDEQQHEYIDEDGWTCDVCGGPMYSAPHWKYGQCDDCGATQELINDDYT